MTINHLVSKYIKQNYSKVDAYNLAAEEIVLSKIYHSPLSEHVTLKGGIVMFVLTNKQRTVTKDIDFDFVSFPITEDAVASFVESLNCNDGFSVSISGALVPLKHEDYHGIRVPLLINDSKDNQLSIKIDIGIHNHEEIPQQKIKFLGLASENTLVLNANMPEQIVAEKLVALARIGKRTTRYKDIFDIYYLLSNGMVDKHLSKQIIKTILRNSKSRKLTISDFKNNIHLVLENQKFKQNFRKAKNQWIKDDYLMMEKCISEYINSVDDVKQI